MMSTIADMSPGEAVRKLLEDDIFLPPHQHLVALSVVGPEEPQKCDQFCIKIRGVFATREEADSHIRRLQKFDNDVNIYVADVGKWLVLPPKKDKISDQRYQDEFLDKTFRGYHENTLEAKQMFDQRKKAVMQQGLDANLTEEERLPPPSNADLTGRLQEGEVVGAPNVGDAGASSSSDS